MKFLVTFYHIIKNHKAVIEVFAFLGQAAEEFNLSPAEVFALCKLLLIYIKDDNLFCRESEEDPFVSVKQILTNIHQKKYLEKLLEKS